MAAPDTEDLDDDLDASEPVGEPMTVEIGPELDGSRLDKALAIALPEISRARLQALIAEGAVSRDGRPVTGASSKVQAGTYSLLIPPARAAEPEPQDLPLSILYEDDQIIVIDKA